jgi:hypothetical protein
VPKERVFEAAAAAAMVGEKYEVRLYISYLKSRCGSICVIP